MGLQQKLIISPWNSTATLCDVARRDIVSMAIVQSSRFPNTWRSGLGSSGLIRAPTAGRDGRTESHLASLARSRASATARPVDRRRLAGDACGRRFVPFLNLKRIFNVFLIRIWIFFVHSWPRMVLFELFGLVLRTGCGERKILCGLKTFFKFSDLIKLDFSFWRTAMVVNFLFLRFWSHIRGEHSVL